MLKKLISKLMSMRLNVMSRNDMWDHPHLFSDLKPLIIF
jgi:hypothetical protein